MRARSAFGSKSQLMRLLFDFAHFAVDGFLGGGARCAEPEPLPDFRVGFARQQAVKDVPLAGREVLA